MDDVKSVEDDVKIVNEESMQPAKMHIGKTWRAEVRTIMGKMRRLEMRGWNNTTQYRLFGKELLQLMRVYKASKRAGCKCKIYSKKKMDKMFSTAEAFNQQAVEGVTQECVCENEKTERSRKVFNDSMKLVGVASFFSEFGERE